MEGSGQGRPPVGSGEAPGWVGCILLSRYGWSWAPVGFSPCPMPCNIDGLAGPARRLFS